MWSSIQVILNQVSKKSFYTFEDIHILTYESPMQSYQKKQVKLWEQIQFNPIRSRLFLPFKGPGRGL